MKYSELVEGNTTLTEKQEFLTSGDMTAITIRIPKNLKEAAAERASLKGISFSAYARMCMIADLAPESSRVRGGSPAPEGTPEPTRAPESTHANGGAANAH